MEHTTPSTELFNEIKEAAKKVWQENYSDEYGYVSEKVNRINSLTNLSDNVMECYRMFDYPNQWKIKANLSKEAIEYINLNN